MAQFAEVPGTGLYTLFSLSCPHDWPALYYRDVNRKSRGTAGAAEMTMI